MLSADPLTTVLPRPRRFGKTLVMSMLRCWFEPTDEDRSWMFEDLEVWRAGADVRATLGKHPVILLSFKDIKAWTWEDCLAGLTQVIRHEVERHGYLAAGLSGERAEDFAALRRGSASRAVLGDALLLLSQVLRDHHGQRVVLLVDEYDTPIHAGFARGYYDEVVGFLRTLLAAGYKGNDALFRGVLTGILHVAKEGLFSGLNNTRSFGVTHPRYAPYFGFSEAQVEALLAARGAPIAAPRCGAGTTAMSSARGSRPTTPGRCCATPPTCRPCPNPTGRTPAATTCCASC